MVTLQDVKEAHKLIREKVHRTPIITSALLNEETGSSIYLKSEHLQKTGSFKIRGATHAVTKAAAVGSRFITAASSGNHGQAVASIANQLGIPATIVVPEDANPVKVAAIKAYGAEVEYCGTTSAERIPRAKRLAEEKDGFYVPPYDHPDIIAGQGTVGLEILEQVPDADILIVPAGGGGLISGILTAAKNINPNVRVIGVEPESANDTYLSLQKKAILSIPATSTIADGLRTSQPGDLTFPILQKYLDELLLVTEEEIKEAFQFLLERTKQMVEPSGAVAAAAALSGKVGVRDKKIVIVLSGGNVDLRKVDSYLPKRSGV